MVSNCTIATVVTPEPTRTNDLMDWELGQNPRLGSLPAHTDTRHPALRKSDGCAYRRFAIAALKDDVTG
jgi:hypothetical protein